MVILCWNNSSWVLSHVFISFLTTKNADLIGSIYFFINNLYFLIMRKISFVRLCLSVLILFSTFACEKNDVIYEDNDVTGSSSDEIQESLQQTADILIEMIKENPDYLSQINSAILKGSNEYVEDRILIKDLFYPIESLDKCKRQQAFNFKKDFKKHIKESHILMSGNQKSVNISDANNADVFIDFLIKNDVSIYCPYPLEDYDKNNRIPAITFNPLNGSESNEGILLHQNGETESVIVNQCYADEHPVWIVNAHEKVIQNHPIIPNPIISRHYEVSINHIYCADYFNESLFEGDLELRICRTDASSNVTVQNGSISATVKSYYPISMPRKYVRYAKNGWDIGWFPVFNIWDSDWATTDGYNGLLVYEYDVPDKDTFDVNTQIKSDDGSMSNTIGAHFENSGSSSVVCYNTWSRDWFYDVLKNGNPNFAWVDDQNNVLFEYNNNKTIKVNQFFWLTASSRTYVTK